jgi:hypothetical protein
MSFPLRLRFIQAQRAISNLRNESLQEIGGTQCRFLGLELRESTSHGSIPGLSPSTAIRRSRVPAIPPTGTLNASQVASLSSWQRVFNTHQRAVFFMVQPNLLLLIELLAEAILDPNGLSCLCVFLPNTLSGKIESIVTPTKAGQDKQDLALIASKSISLYSWLFQGMTLTESRATKLRPDPAFGFQPPGQYPHVCWQWTVTDSLAAHEEAASRGLFLPPNGARPSGSRPREGRPQERPFHDDPAYYGVPPPHGRAH